MGTTFGCPNKSCCTPLMMARGDGPSADSACASGANFVASAPSVRTSVDVFRVSSGLRPHLRHRLSLSLFRAPQKLQVIAPEPCMIGQDIQQDTSHLLRVRCANFGLLRLLPPSLLSLISTPVPCCHAKSSSNTYLFPLTVLALLML